MQEEAVKERYNWKGENEEELKMFFLFGLLCREPGLVPNRPRLSVSHSALITADAVELPQTWLFFFSI